MDNILQHNGILPFLIAFGVASLAYLALIHRLPFKGDFIIKAIPVISLAIAAWIYIPGLPGKLLFAGLLLSAGGDISLSFEGEKFFLMGLGFFLVAHIVYIVTFAQDMTYSPGKLPILIALSVFAIGMAVVLYPKLGEMRIPVFVYISVILAMGITAALWQGPNPNLLLIGAIVFMLSDSMIAVDRFLVEISWSKYFIMATYYGAQIMIWASFFKPLPS